MSVVVGGPCDGLFLLLGRSDDSDLLADLDRALSDAKAHVGREGTG